jgi:hypothetical protein
MEIQGQVQEEVGPKYVTLGIFFIIAGVSDHRLGTGYGHRRAEVGIGRDFCKRSSGEGVLGRKKGPTEAEKSRRVHGLKSKTWKGQFHVILRGLENLPLD